VTDVFSPEFMAKNRIEKGHKVSVIDGKDFDARDIGFDQHIPNCTDFVFYYFKKRSEQKKQYRWLQCKHKTHEDSKPCGMMISDLSKFFDHMRTHTKERPYHCS
jgi:hypothetical protein